MVEEGAADMDADAISSGFESVGAEYSAGAGRDIAIYELRSVSDKAILDRAIDVFNKVITRPSFPEDAMDRVRERVLISLQRMDQSPASVASRTFYRAVYGDHPYSHPPAGERESVVRIQRQHLVDFHTEHYVGANAVLVIVGALRPDQARRRAAEILDAMPRGSKPGALPGVSGPPAADALDVGFPSSQTHLIMGQTGIARSDPDYFPLYVGNHILGGNGLISRLATRIREERGLAYSVYSSFSPMKQAGPFFISLQTRNDQADLAHELSTETLHRFISDGPEAAELDAAKGNIIGGFALRISSNAKIADVILGIAFYGLPLDYLETFSERVSGVTSEQVVSAFRNRVSPDRFVSVRVGGG
jgi:zinc protease